MGKKKKRKKGRGPGFGGASPGTALRPAAIGPPAGESPLAGTGSAPTAAAEPDAAGPASPAPGVAVPAHGVEAPASGAETLPTDSTPAPASRAADPTPVVETPAPAATQPASPPTVWLPAAPEPAPAAVSSDTASPPSPASTDDLVEEYAALTRRISVDAPEAVAEYRFFREKASLSGNSLLLARCTIDLGAALDAAGDLAAARIEFQRAIAHGAVAGENALVGIAKDWLGSLARSEGRTEDALRLHLEALGALRKSGAPLPISRCLNNLGLLRAGEDELVEALECFREARDLRATEGDQAGVARLEANLGVACLGLEKMADAERHFRAALAILDALPSAAVGAGRGLVAAVCTNLSACAHAAGRTDEAAALSERAAEIYEEGANWRGLADARHNRGVAALALGDSSGAVREFNHSSEAAASAEERELAAQTIFNLAVAHAQAGSADMARRVCQAARAEFAHLADVEGTRRTQELLDLLPLVKEADPGEKLIHLAYPMRTRRTWQAARMSG